jgi:hypothetical protein
MKTKRDLANVKSLIKGVEREGVIPDTTTLNVLKQSYWLKAEDILHKKFDTRINHIDDEF